ncbi:hypothetical protein [Thalassolituus oleivorans]|uniref:hypothetical protein n=1 Tax=Thalassolituus oleivorans TaxID=187493 RepID=UPI0023F173F6|nr:hypothetical protein [Thalassolituus oleivorans]
MNYGIRKTLNPGIELSDDSQIIEKERSFFTYGAGNYVRLKDKHMAEGYDK